MFRVMFCIIVAVATAQAWDELNPVPLPVTVGTGSAITFGSYGNGEIWGIFPNEDDDCTYFEYYDLNSQDWVYPDQDLDYLENTAITYQWTEDGAVYVIGNDDGDPDWPMLYCYIPQDESWDEEDIDDFSLGAGASLAFRPNPNYNIQLYPVPGFLYCLAGNGQEFWRYWLPSTLAPVALDGIYPGQSAVIADKTPWFDWPGSTGYHQLQVATSQSFASPTIDVYVFPSEYQVTSALANGTYFWRTRDLNGSGAWSTVHSFTLDGGWTQLADISMEVSYGASLAYEKDYYSGKECLLALVGGEHQYYYVYFVEGDSWHEFTTPKAQGVGSAIVTHEAASETPPGRSGPWAIFAQGSDSLWYHYYPSGGWGRFDAADVFPLPLGPGASLAYSIESGIPYLYLTVGEDGNGPRNNFYRLELPTARGGGQAGPARSASLPARSLSGSRGITVEYQLSAPARVSVTVFDAVGRRVGVLDAGEQQPGTHQLSWSSDGEGRKLSPGTYFVLLDMGTKQARLKAVVR